MNADPDGSYAPAPGEPLLRCERLSVGHAGRAILPPIDVSVRKGELWAVLGRNGSGKTSWLRTLAGLSPKVSGQVTLRAGARITYLPQRGQLDEAYPVRARDVVAMGCQRGASFFGFGLGGASVALSALEQVGAAPLAEEPFFRLSDGQKQRVLFARLIAARADVALLDEPTSAMDVVAEREALGILSALARSGLAIVVVSHYLRLAEEFADRVLLLDRDVPAVVAGTPAEVFAHPAFLSRYSLRPPGQGAEARVAERIDGEEPGLA